MKFYKYNSNISVLNNIIYDKTSAIYNYKLVYTEFYKKGRLHNYKNASYNNQSKYKAFYLNGEFYGNLNKFNKKSWRKFVKLQVFI